MFLQLQIPHLIYFLFLHFNIFEIKITVSQVADCDVIITAYAILQYPSQKTT